MNPADLKEIMRPLTPEQRRYINGCCMLCEKDSAPNCIFCPDHQADREGHER